MFSHLFEYIFHVLYYYCRNLFHYTNSSSYYQEHTQYINNGSNEIDSSIFSPPFSYQMQHATVGSLQNLLHAPQLNNMVGHSSKYF